MVIYREDTNPGGTVLSIVRLSLERLTDAQIQLDWCPGHACLSKPPCFLPNLRHLQMEWLGSSCPNYAGESHWPTQVTLGPIAKQVSLLPPRPTALICQILLQGYVSNGSLLLC